MNSVIQEQLRRREKLRVPLPSPPQVPLLGPGCIDQERTQRKKMRTVIGEQLRREKLRVPLPSHPQVPS